MHGRLVATILVLAAVMLSPKLGQTQQPQLPALKPLPMAPIKPYKPVAVTPPGPYNDASFIAFRKQLADAADRRDRTALAKLVAMQGFFWMQDKDLADKRKSGMANLANAIDLDAKDGSGWSALTGYANEPTAAPLPDHAGMVCAPAEPSIDPQAFVALVKATQTEPPDWGYPYVDGIEVRSAAKSNAPVVEKLGLTLVRVLPDAAPPNNASEPAFLHIATPSGKAGFVPFEAISGLGSDQMCYAKQAGGWKIIGYYGGAAQ